MSSVHSQDRDDIRFVTLTADEASGRLDHEAVLALAGLIDSIQHTSVKATVVVIRGAFRPADPEAGTGRPAGNGDGPEISVEAALAAQTLCANDKPLIVGLDGHACDIASLLLFHADYVMATRRSSIGAPRARHWSAYADGASTLFASMGIGYSRAFGLLALGVPMDAGSASTAGLVNELVEDGGLDMAVETIASRLASRPAEALRITRRMLRPTRAAIKQQLKEEALADGFANRKDR